MKKIIMLFLSLLLLVSVAAAEKQLGMREYASIDELASAVSSYFPRVQGEVKSVESGTVTVALGSKNGLQPGVVLTLWREGREILHPVTGAVIGRAEDEVGTLEVKTVQETTATGTMEKKLSDPKPGDTARITPKKISLGLIPIGSDKSEIVPQLGARLNEQGRFAVLDRAKTDAFLKDRKQDSALIKEMGGAFKLDVVLTVEVHPSDGKHLVTAVIYYADDARPFETITAMLDLRTKRDALGEVRPFFAPVPAAPQQVEEKKSEIPELPFDAQLIAAADLEGTGGLQYVFSDGANLHIYRSEPSGWREVWAETAAYSAGEMRHINLDIADINGNGKPEIFLTYFLRGKVVSSVIEYRDGVYQRIAEVPGFLRVLNQGRRGSILLGQGYDPARFYSGRPKQYAWSGGAYVPGADYPLPKELQIYGFTVADFGEAAPLLVGLDEKNRLVVYSNNTPVWRSDEKYSGLGVSVTKPATGIEAVLRAEGTDDEKTRKVKLPGRVFAADLNNDGKDEIILPKHKGDSIVSGFTDADLVGLGWTGARLEQRWSVPDIPGLVPDLQVLPQQGGGARILALVKTLGGLFKRDRVGVMTYSVK
ncbi:MAG TPA: hypothetical protein VIX18_00535 [Nitrospirota bacterium]